jgi:hypothetical protein
VQETLKKSKKRKHFADEVRIVRGTRSEDADRNEQARTA